MLENELAKTDTVGTTSDEHIKTNDVNMRLESNAALQIQKPIEVVFEAIVNPAKMTKYFISESSGHLGSAKSVIWKFPEFPDKFLVNEISVKDNHSVSFVWDPETVVTITLENMPDRSTLVRVNEGGKELNEMNLKWVLQNTEGWANFLACMKAFLEHGIQLRKGAFDFMRKNKSTQQQNIGK